MGVSSVVIDDESSLEELVPAWDELAVSAGKPFAAPAWALAWWRNAAPRGAQVRVVAVRRGDRLLAVAPLFARPPWAGRAGYEVMSARLAPPAGLLFAPDAAAEERAELLRALLRLRPRPATISFWERVPEEGAEPPTAALPRGAAWVHRASPSTLPLIVLDGLSYDQWLAQRHSKFRQEARRRKRRLDEIGARVELAGTGDVEAAVDAFIRLHAARWEGRGGSDALVPGLREMLLEAADRMLAGRRLRIYRLIVEEETIAVNVLVAAGGVVNGWSSGFDDRWKRQAPSMTLALQAVADAAENGERLVNLGPGRMDYKLRLANDEEAMAVTTLIPRDAAYPLSRLRFLPRQVRVAMGRNFTETEKARLLRWWPGR